MAWEIRINIYKLVILYNFQHNYNNFITDYSFEHSAFSTVWIVYIAHSPKNALLLKIGKVLFTLEYIYVG